MGRIDIIDAASVAFDHPSTATPEITRGCLFAGSDTEPELVEVRLPPGLLVEPHAHSRDEVIAILEGSIRLGRRELGPGSAVSVTADTLYTFRVGPEGVRFLNFRTAGGADYQTKDEVARRRAARVASSSTSDAHPDQSSSNERTTERSM